MRKRPDAEERDAPHGVKPRENAEDENLIESVNHRDWHARPRIEQRLFPPKIATTTAPARSAATTRFRYESVSPGIRGYQ